MKLPECDKVTVAESKITKYLLNASHEKGKSKAAFFMEHGFTLEKWQELSEALMRHAKENEVFSERENEVGINYVVVGPMLCPDQRTTYVKTIWFLRTGTDIPILATAYPDKKPTEVDSTKRTEATQTASVDSDTNP